MQNNSLSDISNYFFDGLVLRVENCDYILKIIKIMSYKDSKMHFNNADVLYLDTFYNSDIKVSTQK